jgi:hypothetical protein
MGKKKSRDTELDNMLVEENVESDVVETVVEDEVPVVSTPETLTGVVSDCTILNVREAADVSARIVCVIKEATELQVIPGESTDDFYKVYLASGINGFCKKEFITIK